MSSKSTELGIFDLAAFAGYVLRSENAHSQKQHWKPGWIRCRKEMEIGISAEKKNLYLQTVENKVTCELRGRSRSIMRLIAPTYTTHSKLAPGAIPFLVKEGKKALERKTSGEGRKQTSSEPRARLFFFPFRSSSYLFAPKPVRATPTPSFLLYI